MGKRMVMGKTVAGVTMGALLSGVILGPPPARAQGTNPPSPPPSAPPLAPEPPDTAVTTTPDPEPGARTVTTVPPGRSYQAAETTYESKPLYGLMATGGTIFLASYLATVVSAAVINYNDCNLSRNDLGCRTAQWPIYVPLVGPFIQMGYLEGENRTVGRTLLAVDGAVQGAGLTMFLIGAIARKRVPAVSRSVQISSFAPAGGAGLMAFGRF